MPINSGIIAIFANSAASKASAAACVVILPALIAFSVLFAAILAASAEDTASSGITISKPAEAKAK